MLGSILFIVPSGFLVRRLHTLLLEYGCLITTIESYEAIDMETAHVRYMWNIQQ